MTAKSKKLCKNVKGPLDKQIITLSDAVLTMQKKIEEQIPVFKEAPLSMTMEKGDGKNVVRSNPTVTEFRALVRDYSSSLMTLKEILEESPQDQQPSPLDAIRERFKAQA
jgi:hypothetical protein